MTREIKFRAWEKDKKTMLTWEKLTPHYHQLIVGLMTDPTDEMPLMQFTGLHDKFGKEIYECDIVRGNLANEMGSYENSVGKVFFNTDRAEFAIECETYPDNQWSIPRDIEVIGNLFENPELLR